MKSSRSLSIALLICVMLIWGSSFVVTKAALGRVPPIFLAFARLAVAAISLSIYAGLTHQLTLRPAPWRTLFGMAISGILIYYIGFNLSLQYTSASQAALVQSCVPAVTAALAVVFLHEPLTIRRVVGIALAIIGVGAMFLPSARHDGAPQPWLGNLIMVCTVLSWAAYTVMAKRLAALQAVPLATHVTVIGALLLAAPAWLESRFGLAQGLSTARWLTADWAAIIYLGVFPSALCFVLYSKALRHLRASQVATFVNLVPLVGVISGVLALGESLSSNALSGGALVLSGVWISTHDRRPG